METVTCLNCVHAKIYPGHLGTYTCPPEPPEAECTLPEKITITEAEAELLDWDYESIAARCKAFKELPPEPHDLP